LQADDLAISDRLGAALEPRSVVPVELRMNHARLLLQAHRAADARQILDGIQQVDPSLREGLAKLRLWVASAQRDRRALTSAAADTALPASVRLQAAEFLIHLGGWSEAARVLRGTCPELSGSERARCDALYDDARP
jgi:thioredoxin-like negative regulator of GroEL